MVHPPKRSGTKPRANQVERLRARVAELEARQELLESERDILRKAAKYFAGETTW